MNVLSYSYWKAVRITHDSTVITNLDLAAHEDYSLGSEKADRTGYWTRMFSTKTHANLFHERFFREHLKSVLNESLIFDRNVPGQLQLEQLSPAL